MNAREKKLATYLGGVAGAVVVWQWALPMVNTYVFDVARKNQALGEELSELTARLEEVRTSQEQYREFVERTGGTDVDKVKNALHAKLNEMIARHQLQNPRLAPRKVAEYRPAGGKKKTGISQITFGLDAEAPLQSLVEFLKGFYELPYFAQVTDLTLTPVSGRNRQAGGVVKMGVTIEALVPPEVDPELRGFAQQPGAQPDKKIKHGERDYAMIWNRTPFEEYVPPKPPPREPPPVIETPVETAPAIVEAPPPPPPPPPVGDPDAMFKIVRMALLYGGVNEALVVNTRDQGTTYVGAGASLDGGKILLVHPLGLVTRREDGEERFYPVGKSLADGMPLTNAKDAYPEAVFAYAGASILLRLEDTRTTPMPAPVPDPAVTPPSTDGVDEAASPPPQVPPEATGAKPTDVRPPASNRTTRRPPRGASKPQPPPGKQPGEPGAAAETPTTGEVNPNEPAEEKKDNVPGEGGKAPATGESAKPVDNDPMGPPVSPESERC